MTLEQLKEMAVKGRKMQRPTRTAAVRLSISESQQNATIYAVIYEQGGARFDEMESWTPIWVPDLKRLYIVYGLSEHGYKVQKYPNSLGKISWRDGGLYSYIRTNNLMGSYYWRYDDECKKKYIDLSPNAKEA